MKKISSSISQIFKRSYSPFIEYTALILFGIFVWWQRIRYIDLQYAWGGFSPMIYVYQKFKPENFVRDFPNGIESYDSSLIMQVYPWLYSNLGISPETLLPIFIAFEYIIFVLAILSVINVILPKKTTLVRILIVVFMISSHGREMNLANFGQQTFWGLYYMTADSLRLFAIGTFLRQRLIFSALLLGICFTVHPTMALMGSIFIFAGFIIQPKAFPKSSVLISIILFSTIAIVWTFIRIPHSSINGSEIPNQIWFMFTQFGSWHFYPVSLGIFTTYHELRFIPFLSFLILLSFYIKKNSPLNDTDKKIVAGVIGMIILVILGVIFSILKFSPTLIKLSLHRANDLIVTVGLIYVVHGLWNEWQSKHIWRPIIATTILISPFLILPGFPILYSLILVFPSYLVVFHRKNYKVGDFIVVAIAGFSIILLSLYFLQKISGSWLSFAYTGGKDLIIFGLIFGGIIYIFSNIIASKVNLKNLKVIPLVCIIILAMKWSIVYITPSKADRVLYQNFLNAQLFVKEKTKVDALFMLDPSLPYGWRDYSLRSSFGNLHEWLHTSWLYSSNFENYQEGLKRFNEFNVDLDRYLHKKSTIYDFFELLEEVQNKFYDFDDNWRLNMAQKYKIDYFVLKKEKMESESQLPVIYENDDFLILSALRS